MRTRGDRADIRQTRVRRGVSRGASRPRLVLVYGVVVAMLSMGIVFAHWTSQTSATVQASTGNVDLNVDGSLSYDFPGCSPGAESTKCDKFDSDVIGDAPMSSSVEGATFTITGWVYKGGDPSEPVGFYYTVSGGTVDIVVKSGRNSDPASLSEGSGIWLNPACEGDPGPGGAVTCTPKNTNAISHIDFCIKVATPPTCLPLMRSVMVSNVGSIPFDLRVSLLGPDGTDYCGVFDLTVQRVIGGIPGDPPLYQGRLCDLIGAPLPLSDQIDPGGNAEFKLTLSFTEPTFDFNGTSGSLTARFAATQWNHAGGWTDVVDLPLSISVGPASSAPIRSDTIASVTTVTLNGATISAPVGWPVPVVIDVLGRSTVTITSWDLDPSDPSAVVGFDFTVSGDPVLVEVRRGALGWVDERWEEENPHVWHDPYGVHSPEARPITSIEFALVSLADDPIGDELTGEEPPAEEPPAEEPPTPDPATLTGVVWLDDGDGVRATAEPGVAGVVVHLLSEGAEVAATTTDADGSYVFTELPIGDYTIEIEAPADHAFTSVAQGSDPALDSDVTPVESAAGPLLGRATAPLSSGMNSGVADTGLLQAPTGADGP